LESSKSRQYVKPTSRVTDQFGIFQHRLMMRKHTVEEFRR